MKLKDRLEKIKKRGKFSKNDLIRMGFGEDDQTIFQDIFGSPT